MFGFVTHLSVLFVCVRVCLAGRWNEYRAAWEGFFDATGCDVLICPVMPIPAAVTPDDVELRRKRAPDAGGDVSMTKHVSWPATIDGQPATVNGKTSESNVCFSLFLSLNESGGAVAAPPLFLRVPWQPRLVR